MTHATMLATQDVNVPVAKTKEPASPKQDHL